MSNIELKNFSLGFDRKILLHDVTASFASGGLTALIGSNGSGKSSLLRVIGGIDHHYKGDVMIDGIDLRSIPKYQLASKISYVNTHRPRMANLRCIDVVRLGRSPHTNWSGYLSETDRRIVENSFEKVGMESFKDCYFNTLSDGESEKIMIARALAQSTPIILLDEPTSFLDLPARYELVKLLKDITSNEAKTVIYSTHELDIALKFSDSVALIEPPSLINLPATEMLEFLKSSQHRFGEILA
ncbi:MAG: ABC transporter ATP-binding protein [Muribaculaceae bacterium]|nr:ABC transporter ATP-binding protein [Muribaculaceae bacterium]